MKSVGDKINAARGNWKFSGETAKKFDNHVEKSVPLYKEGHDLICDLSDFFVKEESLIYEVGSSTGTLTFKLAEHNKSKKSATFIGIDIEKAMVVEANKKLKKNKNKNVKFFNADMLKYKMKKADLIICYYTIQFTPTATRQDLINKLYNNLNWGGALVLFEKVRGPDARFQDIASNLYIDYKLRLKYTPDDIISKSLSLKGILEPFSTKGNIDLLKRAGFKDINTIQKYICFEGFLAIK
jgi:tRNA (cmo5U34)-methyltransferase